MDDLGASISSAFRLIWWALIIAVILVAVLGTLLGLALAGVL